MKNDKEKKDKEDKEKKEKEARDNKFLDDLNLVKKLNISMPPNCILFGAPAVEKQTAAGIWKLEETLSNDEQAGLVHRWHRVLIAGKNDIGIETGDEFWFSPTMDNARRISLEGVAYWHIGMFAVIAIKKAKKIV